MRLSGSKTWVVYHSACLAAAGLCRWVKWKVFCCRLCNCETHSWRLQQSQKSAPSLFSPPPRLPPPLPTLSSDSCHLPTPALSCPPAALPPPPSCPAAAVQPSSVCSPDCAAATAAEDDRCQCGQGSRPENSCCTQDRGGRAGRGRCLHWLPSEASSRPLNNGSGLRRHAEVSLQFQGDLLGSAHVPRGRHLPRVGHQQKWQVFKMRAKCCQRLTKVRIRRRFWDASYFVQLDEMLARAIGW